MQGFLKEFREFAVRGNVIDLAVAVVIGAAFTTIVNSLVADIIMPPIGLLMGGIDFSEFYINLSGTEYASLADAQAAGAPLIRYGIFINAVINFVIVALAIFTIVKQINRFKRSEEAAPPPAPAEDIVLLTEIRDLLKRENP